MLAAPTRTNGDRSRKTSDQRRSTLAREASVLNAQGRRVESQSDYQAVLITGRYLWERREILSVDPWGNVSLQRLSVDKEKLAGAVAVAIALLILIVLGIVFG